jgi:hypothetical protein
VTQKQTIPDAVPGIDFRFVQAVSLTGCRSTLPGEKEIKQGVEKTSTDEQEARVVDRLRTFVAYIFCHVRHGVQQSIQRQADLKHFWSALSAACSSAFRLIASCSVGETTVHSCVKS